MPTTDGACAQASLVGMMFLRLGPPDPAPPVSRRAARRSPYSEGRVAAYVAVGFLVPNRQRRSPRASSPPFRARLLLAPLGRGAGARGPSCCRRRARSRQETGTASINGRSSENFGRPRGPISVGQPPIPPTFSLPLLSRFLGRRGRSPAGKKSARIPPSTLPVPPSCRLPAFPAPIRRERSGRGAREGPHAPPPQADGPLAEPVSDLAAADAIARPTGQTGTVHERSAITGAKNFRSRGRGPVLLERAVEGNGRPRSRMTARRVVRPADPCGAHPGRGRKVSSLPPSVTPGGARTLRAVGALDRFVAASASPCSLNRCKILHLFLAGAG